LRKELLADGGREIAVHREVEPLEDVADQARERGAGCRLMRRGVDGSGVDMQEVTSAGQSRNAGRSVSAARPYRP